MKTILFAAAVLCAGFLTGCGGNASTTPISGLSVQTLSNRADLISGGEALVEVKVPAGANVLKMTVNLDGVDVSSAFTKRADGRVVGLVSGLKVGLNNIEVKSSDGSFVGAKLAVTNHPIGGPVLLSTQSQPWVCATPTAISQSGNTPGSNASGLTTSAFDSQCNIASQFTLFYKTTATNCTTTLPDPSAPALAPADACFKPYKVGVTPADLATTTVNGVTVPYVVRVERGTIDRGIYDIAVLFDPTKPWTANAPQSQWNGKVIYSFGESTGQPRLQNRSEQNWADDLSLSRGFMVVDNSVTDSLYNSNRVLAAETIMMMKEHIVNTYGEIKYTAGNGCSGGSISQNTIASIFPGLLDGIQVSCDFPDSATSGIERSDCVVLVNFYTSTQWLALMAGKSQAEINAKKTAINGHLDQLGCHSWNNDFGFNNRPGNYTPTYVINSLGAMGSIPGSSPQNNCMLPAALVFDPVSNPTGTRCGDPDLAIAVWGTAPGTTRANELTDNVGVQYGLKALQSAVITAEEFVTLNEKIGGLDADFNLTAARSLADQDALTTAYRGGIVSSGTQLAKVAIIDLRGYDEEGIHYIWRSFSERDRLDADGGGHGNQVMWRYGLVRDPPPASGLPLLSLLTMDQWLTALVTIAPKTTVNAEHTAAQVVGAKPAGAFDFCYLTSDTTYSNKVTNQATCDADPGLVPHTSPHQVAGGARTENILKCELKPLNFADYNPVVFNADQQARLNTAFPGGVCDWSKPGVGQQPPLSPQSYQAGPGGQPLPPAPQSSPL